MSWNELNLAEQGISEEDRHEVLNLAAHFRTAFSTDSGRQVLEYLERMTLQRPILEQFTRDNDGNTLAIIMASREGENRIVRTIKTMIRISEEA